MEALKNYVKAVRSYSDGWRDENDFKEALDSLMKEYVRNKQAE
jgi:hypothetical protein